MLGWRRLLGSLMAGGVISASLFAPDARAALELGLRAAQQGRCGEAIPLLRDALRSSPDVVPALHALAVCESRSGRPAEATQYFLRITELAPQSWEAWTNLGANYLAAKNPAAAVPALQRSTGLDPTAMAAWLNLGYAHAQLSQFEPAFEAFEHARQLAPRDETIVKPWLDVAGRLAARAASEISAGRYGEARRLLKLVERPLSISASWQNLLGYAQFKLDDSEAALLHLQKALAMEPDNEDYLLDLGEFLAYHESYALLQEVFEIARQRRPDSPRVLYGLAVAYILQDRGEEAAKLLGEVVSRWPDFELAYPALAECHEAAGRTLPLLELAATMQKRFPRLSDSWFFEGVARLRLAREDRGATSDAIAPLQRAVELDPRSVRAHFQLGKAYGELEEYGPAVDQLQAVLAVEPEHRRARYLLARYYQRQGKDELARAEFRRHREQKEQERHRTYRRLLITSRQQ